MKILFINGAPRSGKDTIANLIKKNYKNTHIREFKTPLLAAVKGMFQISDADWDKRYNSDMKDKRWSRLNGMSQREALIWMSEDVVKPEFGEDFFGRIMVKSLEDIDDTDDNTLVVIPDSGFKDEMLETVLTYGHDACTMMHVFREGCTFENDSRGPVLGIDLKIKGLSIVNNGTEIDLKKKIVAVLKEVLTK